MTRVVPNEQARQPGHPLQVFLQIPDKETDLTRRGVVLHDPQRASELRDKARRFVCGCNALFGAQPFEALAKAFAETQPEDRGFLVEGAAMGAVIRDGLSLRRGFLETLFADYGGRYEYLLTVGAGWGIARMPWRARAALAGIAPEIQMLAADGRGFHDLYFSPAKAKNGRIGVKGAQQASYDAGLGRSIWFVASGVSQQAGNLIDGFAAHRHGDLLSGLGLAMAYAGATQADDWHHISMRYPSHRSHFLQGVSFGFEAHRCAGIRTATMETAVQALGLQSIDFVADVSRDTRFFAANHPGSPADRFVAWRKAIRDGFDV